MYTHTDLYTSLIKPYICTRTHKRCHEMIHVRLFVNEGDSVTDTHEMLDAYINVHICIYIYVCIYIYIYSPTVPYSRTGWRAVAVIALKNINLLESAIKATMLIIQEEATYSQKSPIVT